MEQIYYTQCPIGYGLGASNGFQIKRLSVGYPAAGDFRALGMRAFLPGSRTTAPPALRYRREGGVAEVAWLTPRAQEYQTERGLWGRPGGHFAHGVRLDAQELAALANWPAGLFDRPAWRRADPEPTRGRPPEPVALDLMAAPTFAAVAPLAEGEDPELLARLLTALAAAARDGRTLYLIDEPDRLARRVALLTFAFPAALRPDLSFSTYHDRPEELPGYRLQGTTPSARPNRAALASSGTVADLDAGTIEPPVAPAAWARTLAGWLARRSAAEDRAWTATDDRAARARLPAAPDSPWADAWLDPLVAFDEAVRPPAAPPADGAGWGRLADLAAWAAAAGLGAGWARARPPSWWSAAAAAAAPLPEARRALVAQGQVPESWGAGHGAAWGEVVARWLAGAGEAGRDAAVATLLKVAPPAERPGFLAAALRGAPAAALARLRAATAIDPALLLPLEVRSAAARALDRGDPGPLRDALGRALDRPAVLTDALEALAAEAADRPAAVAALAPVLADLFDSAAAVGRADPFAWALGRADAASWLGPHLRRLFGPPNGPDAWRRLRDRVPPPLRPALIRAVLGVAADPRLADEPFRWGVEEFLLAIPEADRPHDPRWPDLYLARTPSGLDLVGKLFSKGHRHPELRRWLKAARDRGEVSAAQAGRIAEAAAYARALASGDARSLMEVRLPEVPPADLGALLGQVLDHVGGASSRRLGLCLESCRLAWPGAFDPGVPGLGALARPLAQALAGYRADPGLWLDHLRRSLGQLGVAGQVGPDSLAAEVVAATARLPGADPWRLRRFLVARDDTWRLLAVDARRDGLEGPAAPAALGRWDREIERTDARLVTRFYELMLNACDGPALAACVSAHVDGFRKLEPIPWWPSARTPGAVDDLRDGFARLAPMAPLAAETLQLVRAWMRTQARSAPAPLVRLGGDGPDLVPLDGGGPTPPRPPPAAIDQPHLSDAGLARWLCLDGLSAFARPDLGPGGRWSAVLNWIDARLPLADLDPDDRHRFLAHVIVRTEALDSVQLARLCLWLVKSDVTDPDRLGAWADDLPAPPPDALRVGRMALVGDLRGELKKTLRDQRGG